MVAYRDCTARTGQRKGVGSLFRLYGQEKTPDPFFCVHFHQGWTLALCNALNAGGLPPDYFALAEQRIRGPIPDVLALHLSSSSEESGGTSPGLAVATAP